MKKKISDALLHERLPVFLVIAACILCLPSLWGGFLLDDHFHRLHFIDTDFVDESSSKWDLFTFITGDIDIAYEMMDFGVLPWWTFPEIRAKFWRPLSVLTHWIDYIYLFDHPVFMHMHSLIWFCILIVVTSMLYRQIHGPSLTAGLACVLFALDDAHAWPVAWLANRNALLAAVFGFLAIYVHGNWRKHQWTAGAIVAPLLLLLGLFSAEAAIATRAYIFAYALFLDNGTAINRILSLVPCGLVTVIWFLLFHFQGYGTFGMELYLDPGSEPVKYLLAVLERAPILLSALFGFPPAYIFVFLQKSGILLLWLAALFALALFMIPLFFVLSKNSISRFWFTGMVLSILPVCATVPHERLLMFAGLGGLGLIAQYLNTYFTEQENLPQKRIWKTFTAVFTYFWIFVHLFLAPVSLVLGTWSTSILADITEKTYEDLPNDNEIKNQHLILVNCTLPFFMQYLPIIRSLDNQPSPALLRVLSSGNNKVRILRADEKTLIITPEMGFINAPFDDLFRGEAHPLERYQTINLTDLCITILELTEDRRPAKVKFSFSKPLESTLYRWFAYENGTYYPFSLPEIGSFVTIDEIESDPFTDVF